MSRTTSLPWSEMGQVIGCDGPREEKVVEPEPEKKVKKKKKKKKVKKVQESQEEKFARAASAARAAIEEVQQFGKMARESKKALQESFMALDEDNSGELSIDELDPFLRGIYEPTPEEIKEFLEKFDHDGDGEITFPEFQVGMKRMFPGEYEGKDGMAHLKEYFKKYDKDGGGFIQEKELIQISRDLMQVNPTMKKKTMMLFDVNQDGKITFDEFVDVIVKLKGNLHQIWETHRKTAKMQDKSKEVRSWKVKKEEKR